MLSRVVAWWSQNDSIPVATGNARFDHYKDLILKQYQGSYVLGGYIRGMFDSRKEVHDLDVCVKSEDFKRAKNLLKSVGCQEIYTVDDSHRDRAIMDSIEDWAILVPDGNYARFRCANNVEIDMVDDLMMKNTMDTMPSDIHHLVLGYDEKTESDIFRSIDQENYPIHTIVMNMSDKKYVKLTDGNDTDKLKAEGFVELKK